MPWAWIRVWIDVGDAADRGGGGGGGGGGGAGGGGSGCGAGGGYGGGGGGGMMPAPPIVPPHMFPPPIPAHMMPPPAPIHVPPHMFPGSPFDVEFLAVIKWGLSIYMYGWELKTFLLNFRPDIERKK